MTYDSAMPVGMDPVDLEEFEAFKEERRYGGLRILELSDHDSENSFVDDVCDELFKLIPKETIAINLDNVSILSHVLTRTSVDVCAAGGNSGISADVSVMSNYSDLFDSIVTRASDGSVDPDTVGAIFANINSVSLYIGSYFNQCRDDYSHLLDNDNVFYRLPTDVAKTTFAGAKEFLRDICTDDETEHLVYLDISTYGYIVRTHYNEDEWGVSEEYDGFFTDPDQGTRYGKLYDYIVAVVGEEYEDIKWGEVYSIGVSPRGFFINYHPNED